jgi:predicted ribosome quality control (RQC) complex YloA/Tae2 family protein
MKSEMTNVDICCAVNELQKLVNGRLDKAFLIDNEQNRELILKNPCSRGRKQRACHKYW